MRIRSLEGSPIDLDDKAIEAFRTSHKGPVIAPGDGMYDECRSVWNAMIDRRPGLVARCLGTADVIAAVAFARQHRLLLSIKGGGHNIAGLAVAEGGLMLDLSLMRGVFVDPATRTAHAQAGCLLGDVDRETQIHGLAAVLGFVSNTGIAGLTLGGGFGYLTRRFGWTSDNVTSIDIVTADGKLVRASEQQNADLFWGLRGGGGNFGVATSFEYQLYPVGPEIVGGIIAWPGEQAPQVLERFRELNENGPQELSVAAVLRIAPPAPWIAPEFHGKPMIAFALCHTGDPNDGERIVASLADLGPTIGNVVQRRSYASQQSILDATQPKGRRYYWKSEYLPRLDPALLAKMPEWASTISSPHAGVILFPLGNVVGQRPADHSAVGNRDASIVLNIAGSWDKPDDDARQIEWARAIWRDARRFSTGGTYINFLTEEDGGDRIQAAYGKNLDRLTALKSRWDPDNRFRANKNVAPGAVQV